MTMRYEVSDHVATITIDRPEAKNAFTIDMVDAWAEMIRAAKADPIVGAVVLTGAGDAFCAGGDLTMIDGMENSPLVGRTTLTEHVHRVALAMDDLDKPSIAAINGVAVGAGMDMALMCDIRFMARGARMSEGYVTLGLVPGDGGAHYLPRIVGVAKALELLLTGDAVGADEALAIGLVSRVVDDADLLAETQAFAARLAAGPPVATRLITRAVHLSLHNDLRTNLDLISSYMGLAATGDHAREARDAWRERRPPKYHRG